MKKQRILRRSCRSVGRVPAGRDRAILAAPFGSAPRASLPLARPGDPGPSGDCPSRGTFVLSATAVASSGEPGGLACSVARPPPFARPCRASPRVCGAARGSRAASGAHPSHGSGRAIRCDGRTGLRARRGPAFRSHRSGRAGRRLPPTPPSPALARGSPPHAGLAGVRLAPGTLRWPGCRTSGGFA